MIQKIFASLLIALFSTVLFAVNVQAKTDTIEETKSFTLVGNGPWATMYFSNGIQVNTGSSGHAYLQNVGFEVYNNVLSFSIDVSIDTSRSTATEVTIKCGKYQSTHLLEENGKTHISLGIPLENNSSTIIVTVN